jgi:tetratricopeptide (TPR) repeat protein
MSTDSIRVDSPGSDSETSLIRSLEDLEREHAAGDLNDADFAMLSAEYKVRIASALRNETPQQSTPTTSTTIRKRSRGRTVATAVACLGVAIGTGLFVANSAGERTGNQGLTGTVRSAGNSGATQTTYAANVEALLAQGRSSLGTDPVASLRAFDGALALNPKIPEALAYSGWVLRIASRSAEDPQATELVQAALKRIDRAIAVDSNYPDAHAFRGIILLRDLDRKDDAAKEFKLLSGPTTPPFIQQLVASATAESADSGSSEAEPAS